MIIRVNTLELKSARVRKGYTQKSIAQKLKLSNISYGFKERGKIEFTISEMLSIVKILELNIYEINKIFFDNKLTEVVRNLQKLL